VSSAIRARGLGRRFGSVAAVSDLDLDVPAGSIYGFLGPNGAGKTTTIRLLLGLLRPTMGEAEVLGHDVRTDAGKVREAVGVLLETDGLYHRLTARQNLEFFGRVARVPPGERARRIRALLEHIDLWERCDEPVADFSLGMRKKLALARAFLHRPTLLFLDEPTSGLDTPTAVGLRQELLRLAREQGVTVFLTTHNLLEAEKLCDRVAVIRKGRRIAEGAPETIRARSRRALLVAGSGFGPALVAAVGEMAGVGGARVDDGRLRVELDEGAGTAPIIRALVEGGADVAEARVAGASLEETFLALLEEQEAGESGGGGEGAP
jgi:ABC-2 type transport system ATP-binding protein